MERYKLKNGKKITVNSPGWGGNEEYQLIRVETSEIERIRQCVESGFRFGDRLMCMELDLKRWEPKYQISGDYTFSLTPNWDIDAFYDMAKHYFQNDRRFAVDYRMEDEKLKNEMVGLYLQALKKQQYTATCLHREQELIGFQLWKMNETERSARIIMGVVSPQYANRGIAIYLYTETLKNMKEQGALKLAEKISTSNPASIKLHLMLAGDTRLIRNIHFEDEYLYNKESE